MARPKAFQKEEVLDRAVDLFWQRGFHATSISQLVDHLGINRASLYDTFGGKEELFQLAFEKYIEKNKKKISFLLGDHSSIKEAFRTLFYQALEEPSVEDSAPKGCFMVNSTAELLPEDEWLRKILELSRSELEVLFTHAIRTGQQTAEIPPTLDAEAVGSLLFTFYSGIQVMTKINGKPGTLRSAVDTALAILDPV